MKRPASLFIPMPDLALSAAEIDAIVRYARFLEIELAKCYKHSGADPDSNEDWRLAPHAALAVRDLRKDYDEYCAWEVAT